MAERLLIATRNKLLIWDDGPRPILERRVPTWVHHFYGITWDTEGIYVTERMARKHGVIRVFDKEFNWKGEVPLGVDVEDPHQIFWWDGILYITDTRQDRMLLWNGSSIRAVKWQRPDNYPLHSNSIWCDGERFYVLEHRGPRMPKWVRILDLDFKVVGHIELTRGMFTQAKRILHGVHNVYVEDRTLYVCSPTALIQHDMVSGHSETIVPQHLIDNTYYVRGLARVPGKFFIGLSEVRERSERAKGDSSILVTDDDFNMLDVLMLEDTGALHEIRAIDGPDWAHNGIRCPLLDGKRVNYNQDHTWL